MKKFVAWLMPLLLSIGLFSVEAQAFSWIDMVGTWELQNWVIIGTTYEASALGEDVLFVVHNDGTAVLHTADELFSGKLVQQIDLINGEYKYGVFIKNADWAFPLWFDDQGRIHLELTLPNSGTKIDLCLSLPETADTMAKDTALVLSETNMTVGSYITFGAYEQDNNTTNGKEPIEWLVLTRENGRALVVSRYALDCKPYNERYSKATWETCTLRTWLNQDFLNEGFSSTEQAMIATVTVSADKTPSYSTAPGMATQDKVFLLSIVEANKYFTTDSTRQCQPTVYAKAQGASTNRGGCWWWARSPGRTPYSAAYITLGGSTSSDYVNDDNTAVRPALWINLEP